MNILSVMLFQMQRSRWCLEMIGPPGTQSQIVNVDVVKTQKHCSVSFQVLGADSSFCSASPLSAPPSVLPESDPVVPLEAAPGDTAPHGVPSGVAAASERGLEAGLALRSPWVSKVASRLSE